MREIKFRAWDLDKKIMFNACFVGIGKVFSITKTFNPSKQLENVILMQYTGLEDKNGVEIYEGDIIREGEGIINVVVNRGGCYWLEYDYPLYVPDKEWIEVIGNIYENPKLLNNN
jgi:uncharacterized phage protein (TIGR01671 family)